MPNLILTLFGILKMLVGNPTGEIHRLIKQREVSEFVVVIINFLLLHNIILVYTLGHKCTIKDFGK